MDDRAVSPVVGKALEATLVLLYVGLVTATLYGGAVPEYRTTAGAEIAERTAASAASDIEGAIPPETVGGEVKVGVELPPTVANEAYRIRAGRDVLVFEHPNPEVSTAVPLVVPDRVSTVTGTWESGGDNRIRVEAADDEIEVYLE